jgi:gamma-glutamyltranspeptidase/glutathione hydrolase
MMPQPAAGGAQVLAMAHFIERWTASQPFPARADAVAHLLAEAMRRSFALRHHFSGDGDRPARRLTEVYPQKALDAVSAFDLARAATELVYLTDKPLNSHQNGIHTSHVSIIDAEGTRVASTHTVNLYLGSGIIAPESGVLLNNEMDDFAYSLDTSNAFGLAGSEANLVAAGKRPVSSMAPMVAICGNETLILGTPGGSRIPTTVLQVFARWRLSGMALPDAVAAPRVHQQWQSSTWTPARLDVEQAGDADEWVKGLQLRGHAVQRRGPWCNVQAVRRITGPRGRVSLEAVSDPRGEGGAIAR